jgi:hypothetical protein
MEDYFLFFDDVFPILSSNRILNAFEITTALNWKCIKEIKIEITEK